MNDVFVILMKFDSFDAVFTSNTTSLSESSYPYLIEYSTFSVDSCSFSVDVTEAPNEITDQFWSNREVEVWQIPQTAGSIYEGKKVFSGIITKEPSSTNNVYALSCARPTKKSTFVPDSFQITTGLYPRASEYALGKNLPTIFGSVTAPMLGTKVPVADVLTAASEPNSHKFSIGDASKFPDSGSVVVGDKTYQYNSKNNNDLLGVSNYDYYPEGSQVALVGEVEYLASSHPVSITKVVAGTNILTDYQSIGNGVRFDYVPTFTKEGSVYTAMLQFDRSATGSYTQTYNIEYRDGETIKPISADSVSVSTSTVSTPETTRTVTGNLSYNITSAVSLGQVSPKGNLTYTTQASAGGYVIINNEAYDLYKITASASKAITTPNGAELTVVANKSTSRQMDLYPAYDITTSFTVNGSSYDGTTNLTSSGTVTIASETVLYIGISNNVSSITRTIIKDALRTSKTVDELFAKLNKRQFVFPSNYDYIVNVVAKWSETTAGNAGTTTTVPSGTDYPDRTASVNTTYDLHALIVAPATIPAGNYTFTIVSTAPPRTDIGFTHSTLTPIFQGTLGGVPFLMPENGGTTNVVVSVTPGQVLELVHVVNIDNVSVDAKMNSLFWTPYFEAPPANTRATSVSLLIPKITHATVTWSQSSISNACLNANNAIRYVTNNNLNQTATFISAVDTTNGTAAIQFAPASSTGEGIVRGFYQVSFAVNLQNYKGGVSVTIGNTLVYSADEGITIYNWSPATVLYDENTNVLPVKVEGDLSQVLVSVTSASRLVYVGNLGGGKYATLRMPSNTRFKAIQTDINPNRGVIDKAYLAVEWFQSGLKGTPAPSVSVRFNDILRGNLYADTIAGSKVNQTVTVGVDTNKTGRVALTNSNLLQGITGGGASLQLTTSSYEYGMVPNPGVEMGGSGLYRAHIPCPDFHGWRGYSVDGFLSFTFYVQAFSASGIMNYWDTSTSQTAGFNVGDILNTLCFPTFLDTANNPISIFEISSPTQITAPYEGSGFPNFRKGYVGLYSVTYKLKSKPSMIRLNIQFDPDYFTPKGIPIQSVKATWVGGIASRELSSFTSYAAGGGTYANTANDANKMALTDFAITTSNGSISITVPDSPRTILSTFPLPEIKTWDDFTNKSVEIVYEAGTSSLDVNLIQVQLVAEYVEDIRSPIGTTDYLVGDIQGLSSNPADVIKYLAEKCGYTVDPVTHSQEYSWFEANDFRFNRYLPNATEAETLLHYAAEQCNVMLALRNNELKMYRWFNLDAPVYTIDQDDLLEHPMLSPVERIENDITVKYAEDYTNNKGFTKTVQANEVNNMTCLLSVRNLKSTETIEVECGFISDQVTADLFLSDYTKRHATPHNQIVFKLPHTYLDVQEGYLTKYDDIVYRVIKVDQEEVWVTLYCEEVVS